MHGDLFVGVLFSPSTHSHQTPCSYKWPLCFGSWS